MIDKSLTLLKAECFDSFFGFGYLHNVSLEHYGQSLAHGHVMFQYLRQTKGQKNFSGNISTSRILKNCNIDIFIGLISKCNQDVSWFIMRFILSL